MGAQSQPEPERAREEGEARDAANNCLARLPGWLPVKLSFMGVRGAHVICDEICDFDELLFKYFKTKVLSPWLQSCLKMF